MAYYFFLGEMMLPVPPAKMTTKIKNRNKTINLINDGEVNLVKTAGLTEISFDIRLPGDSRPYANYNNSLKSSALSYLGKRLFGKDYSYKPPSYFLPKIKKLKTSREPFDLVVLRMSPSYTVLFDTCMTVTLESYSITEDAREGFDLTIPVTLKQYVDYGTKEVEVTADENGNKTVTIKQERKTKTLDALRHGRIVRGDLSIWEVLKKGDGIGTTIEQLGKISQASGQAMPYGRPIPGTNINLPSGVIH